MRKTTLIVMAAGIGSRFRGGIKQLAPVGPNGENIMDYSIYDAIEAGFSKIVFVIRKELEKDFRETVGKRIEKYAEVAYVFQELADIPEQFKELLAERKKPWGTGQAVLCCRDVVKEPFLVINADDYYGKEAYREAYAFLNRQRNTQGRLDIGMVGFVLKNTLSENGTVTRGVCKVDDSGHLLEIQETYEIARRDGKIVASGCGAQEELNENAVVSMNMWALEPGFFAVLEKGFSVFLGSLMQENVKTEYLLPQIIGELVENGRAQVSVLNSRDKWFGVTYQEDKDVVVSSLQRLIAEGVYPEKLFDESREY